ncbi:MAG TPA: NAD(P)/FAD-dependent oxidoreductase [Pseudonocardiaceae bacterium]|jgi:monoamine oxidase|nr:NAD(P)/FAD-dependent oxidoreductase [Pseudonocardiaceae bacterium]
MFDVIVIGAGIAGLTAARDQRDAGRSVLVIEARDRIGGRTHYGRLQGLDQEVEFGGGWVVPACQPNLAREARRYGLEYGRGPVPEHRAWHFGGTTRHGEAPVPAAELAEFERAMSLLVATAGRIEWGRPFEDQGLADLDIPFAQWLDDNEVTGATRELCCSYGAAVCFGAGPDEVSALHVLSWTAGFGNRPWQLFSGPMIRLADGTASLYDALADGLDIRLSTPVIRVAQDDDSVTVTTADGASIAARAAVVAVPLNTWADIDFHPALSPGKQRFTAERLAGHDIKIWVQVRNAPRYFAGMGWNTPLEWLTTEFERPDGSIMVGFGQDEKLIDPTDRDSVARAVRTFLPDADVVAWWSEDWNGSPYSAGTWTAFRPGQITRLAADSRKPEGRRLVFATADTAVGFSGWMDGAIESGTTATAALAAILDLGRA